MKQKSPDHEADMGGLLDSLTGSLRAPQDSAGRMPRQEAFQLLRRFLPFLRPWRKYGILAGIFLFISVLLQLPLPLITRHVIDHVFPARDVQLLNWLVLGFACLLLLGYVLSLLSSFFLAKFRQNVLLRVTMRLFQHVEHLGLAFHNDTKSGYLMSRIGNDPQQLNGLMAESLLGFVRNVVTFLAGVGILLYLHWRLALVAMLVLPSFIFVLRFFSCRVRAQSAEVQERLGQIFDVMGESLAGISAIKSFCAETVQARKLEGKFRAAFRTNLRFTMVGTLSAAASGLITGIGPLALLAYGGREVMVGNLSLGSFVAFSAYVGYLYGPVSGLMDLNLNIQASLASLARVMEILSLPTEDDASDLPLNQAVLPRLAGQVVFKDVSFSYNGGPDALANISFSVEPGEKIALVGRSGAGKTSLINLIMKFYSPRHGTVSIDGHDLGQIRARDLRRHLGIVLQNPFIFSGSVADNIRMAKQDATEEEILQVTKAAHAHEFIERLPDGYDTEVGEFGVKLSGGERKRLAIARAMVRDPEILILDEATSEVDSESERIIQEALANLLTDRTTFIIAHRLATIRNVDRILLIDRGRILDRGPHNELYDRSPLYRKLYDEQFAGDPVRRELIEPA